MATSRTGTGSHKRFRTAVLTRDRDAGLTHCPCDNSCKHHIGHTCNATLDYEISRQPNSAEPDHIIPHARGGTDHPDNGRTICRQCNQARGKGRRARQPTAPATTTTLVTW